VADGRVLCRAGDQGDALFVLLEGTAVVRRGGKTVAHLGPGDYFGELALLDPGPRSADVTATSDAKLAVLGVRMFRVLLRDLPTLSAKLLADLAGRVRDSGNPDG
jgi:CRP/FNR family transcriptional regulator